MNNDCRPRPGASSSSPLQGGHRRAGGDSGKSGLGAGSACCLMHPETLRLPGWGADSPPCLVQL